MQHVYEMVDGVVRVYAGEGQTEELFPVYDATTFFTDMHRILRIVALGNVRTLCHHRLRLLEQVRQQCMPCHVLFSFLAGRC
jgi:AMP deaminase